MFIVGFIKYILLTVIILNIIITKLGPVFYKNISERFNVIFRVLLLLVSIYFSISYYNSYRGNLKGETINNFSLPMSNADKTISLNYILNYAPIIVHVFSAKNEVSDAFQCAIITPWKIPSMRKSTEHWRALVNISENHNIKIFGIAYQDTKEDAESYLKNFVVSFGGNPYFQIAHDTNQKMKNHLKIFNIPKTFIINKQGLVTYSQDGHLESEDVDMIVKAYKEALN